MSGYGIAGRGTELIVRLEPDCNFYVSPIQCPTETTYDGTTNIQQSVVSLGEI